MKNARTVDSLVANLKQSYSRTKFTLPKKLELFQLLLSEIYIVQAVNDKQRIDFLSLLSGELTFVLADNKVF